MQLPMGAAPLTRPRHVLPPRQAEGFVHDLAKCEAEEEEDGGANAAAAQADEEDGEDGDDEFDPYLFISTLPPLNTCVPDKRTPVLPKKARGSPRITLVRPRTSQPPSTATAVGEGPTGAPTVALKQRGPARPISPPRPLPSPSGDFLPRCPLPRALPCPPSAPATCRPSCKDPTSPFPPRAIAHAPTTHTHRPSPQVLDLDETLVHSTLDDKNASDFSFPVHFHNQTHTVNVRCRPHLEAFMEHVGPRFEVVIFTASQRVYAERLLDIIDPEQKYFAHRIFRDSCVYVDGNYLKDLTVRGRQRERAGGRRKLTDLGAVRVRVRGRPSADRSRVHLRRGWTKLCP